VISDSRIWFSKRLFRFGLRLDLSIASAFDGRTLWTCSFGKIASWRYFRSTGAPRRERVGMDTHYRWLFVIGNGQIRSVSRLRERRAETRRHWPRRRSSHNQIEPWKVEKRGWWPLPWEPPWLAQCIPYGETELNMASVGFICAALFFRALLSDTRP